MNLAELMSQSNQPEPSFPLPEAQRMELTAILRDYETVHGFTHGDFVRWKRGMGPMMNERRPKIVFMFWKMLDRAHADDAEQIAARTGVEISTIQSPDCLVARAECGTLIFDVAQVAMLDPAPEAESA